MDSIQHTPLITVSTNGYGEPVTFRWQGREHSVDYVYGRWSMPPVLRQEDVICEYYDLFLPGDRRARICHDRVENRWHLLQLDYAG